MTKSIHKMIIALFISVLLVACATNPDDGEDRENDPNAPMEQRDRDEQPNEFENDLDRDPNNENILPELETEDEDRMDTEDEHRLENDNNDEDREER